MGCGPLDLGDAGMTIVPAQPEHTPVTGLFVANQFGAERLDSVTEAEIRIPSSVDRGEGSETTRRGSARQTQRDWLRGVRHADRPDDHVARDRRPRVDAPRRVHLHTVAPVFRSSA